MKKNAGKKRPHMSQGKMHGLVLKMVGNSLWALLMAVFIFIGIIGGRSLYDFGYRVFANEGEDEDKDKDIEQFVISISEGSTVLGVGLQLQNQGFIDDAYVFLAQSIIFELDVNPGTYTISKEDSSRELLETFNLGPSE